MRNVIVPVASAIVALFAGCGSSDPIDRLQAAAQMNVDDICTRCPSVIGGSTTELQCRAAAESQLLSETEEGCLRDVYRAHQTELDAYYDCLIPATEALSRCYRAAIDTCPPAASETMACGATFTTALDACPDLTSGTVGELSACTAP